MRFVPQIKRVTVNSTVTWKNLGKEEEITKKIVQGTEVGKGAWTIEKDGYIVSYSETAVLPSSYEIDSEHPLAKVSMGHKRCDIVEVATIKYNIKSFAKYQIMAIEQNDE